MRDIPVVKEKIIGREYIQLKEAFFDMPYVKKYMDEKQLTKETIPKVVLQ